MQQLFGDQLGETRGDRWARCGYLAALFGDTLVAGGRERAADLSAWALDARHGLRNLRRTPAFAGAVVVTLALGIGASTAIFSIVDGVLLRPLPYPDPDRLVRVRATWKYDQDSDALSYPDFLDLRQRSSAFDAVVALYWFPMTITGDGEPERIEAMMVTPGFGVAVGLEPALGRWFAPGEHAFGQDRVAVLSYGLWQRRYGGDPEIVGKTIRLSGETFAVVGVGPAVVPDGIPAVRPAVVWTPLGFEGQSLDQLPGRSAHRYHVIGRLREGVTVEAAAQQLAAISAQLEEEHPDDNTDKGATAVMLHGHATLEASQSLYLMLGAVAGLLLIAIANVSGLMLTHAAERAGDLALRAAIGASRTRLIGQLLTESLFLSVLGGALGLLFAIWALDLFLALGAGSIPLASRVHIDVRVLGFTTALVAATAALCGGLPAVRTTRAHPGAALRSGGHRSRTIAGGRLRSGLVIAEVAVTSALLIGAGLLLQSFVLLHRVDPGIAKDVLTFRLVPPPSRYDDDAVRLLQTELLERIRALGGVEDAAAISLLPMSGLSTCGGLRALDRPPFPPGQDACAEVRIVTPGYFDVMRIPLLRGRGFRSSDRAGAQNVVVINEQVAQLLWAGDDPLGRQLTTGWGVPRTVVGIVANVKQFHLYEEPRLQTYLPAAQQMRDGFNVVVRAERPLTLADAMRRAVWAIDADLAVTGMGLMGEYIARRESIFGFRSTLIGGFAVASLLIAAVGLYGSIAYGVSRRRREMAIRQAVGARRGQLMSMVMVQGMRTAALGIAAGLILALTASRALGSMLYGIAPRDPATFAAVSALMLLVAMCANYLPAWRAARVDPKTTLRDG